MEFTDAALEPFGEKFLDMAIPTQLSLKTAMVFRILKELKGHGCLPWTGSHRAELCFDEALTNAIMHGNKLDPTKKIHVQIFADQERWGAIIEDEGDGFSEKNLPRGDDTEALFRETGRGIMLMNSYLDGLRYNRKGNRMMMVRRRQAEPEAAEAEAAIVSDEAAPTGGGPVIRTSSEGVEVLEVASDRITEENAGAVREAAASALEKSQRIVLDLSHVTYVSSIGLSTLINIFKTVQSKKGHLLLASTQPAVHDILKSAHLLPLFKLAPDARMAASQLAKLSAG